MPNYQFTIADTSASASRTQAIAEAVTEAHRRVTGAPASYVFASFVTLPESALFVSGATSSVGRLTGIIRRGRTDEVKKRLILALADAWCTAGGERIEDISIFLHEIPGFQAMENGVLLPEAWDDAEAILS
jgi:phenylpyruvate tautomerase PptA (4-oxalocrotonate tautomerase family)